MSSYTIPHVVTRDSRGERVVDVYSHLLSERIVYLGTAIDAGVANALIAQLLHLEADAPELPGGPARTWRLVLDLGSGAFGPLQALAAPDQVDAVMLSHLHADHCLDVTALHVAASYGPYFTGRPVHSLPVWGPAGVRERITRAY